MGVKVSTYEFEEAQNAVFRSFHKLFIEHLLCARHWDKALGTSFVLLLNSSPCSRQDPLLFFCLFRVCVCVCVFIYVYILLFTLTILMENFKQRE